MSYSFPLSSDLSPEIIGWFMQPEATAAQETPPDPGTQALPPDCVAPGPMRSAPRQLPWSQGLSPWSQGPSPWSLGAAPRERVRRSAERPVVAAHGRPPNVLSRQARSEFEVALHAHRRLAHYCSSLPQRLRCVVQQRLMRNELVERRLIELLRSQPFNRRVHRQFSHYLSHYLDVTLALQRLLNECDPAALSELLEQLHIVVDASRALLLPNAPSGTVQAFAGVFGSLLGDFDRCATLPACHGVLEELRQCMDLAQTVADRAHAERMHLGVNLSRGPIFRPQPLPQVGTRRASQALYPEAQGLLNVVMRRPPDAAAQPPLLATPPNAPPSAPRNPGFRPTAAPEHRPRPSGTSVGSPQTLPDRCSPAKAIANAQALGPTPARARPDSPPASPFRPISLPSTSLPSISLPSTSLPSPTEASPSTEAVRAETPSTVEMLATYPLMTRLLK